MFSSEKFVKSSQGQSGDETIFRVSRHNSNSSLRVERRPSATTRRYRGLAARMASKTRAVWRGRLKTRKATGAISWFTESSFIFSCYRKGASGQCANGLKKGKGRNFLSGITEGRNLLQALLAAWTESPCVLNQNSGALPPERVVLSGPIKIT